MDLSTLVKMSNTYGSNPDYVLAGGGNTSVKDDTTLYVKGSGTQLATIKAEEFVKMDRVRLNKIMKTEYPADDVKRESAYLADVMAAVTDEDKTKRPSVEALLHNLFAYTYVLHVHPTLINGLTCGKGAKALSEQLLGKDVLWIDICKPGYTLARICFEKMNAYKEETGKDVQVLLLQNQSRRLHRTVYRSHPVCGNVFRCFRGHRIHSSISLRAVRILLSHLRSVSWTAAELRS